MLTYAFENVAANADATEVSRDKTWRRVGHNVWWTRVTTRGEAIALEGTRFWKYRTPRDPADGMRWSDAWRLVHVGSREVMATGRFAALWQVMSALDCTLQVDENSSGVYYEAEQVTRRAEAARERLARERATGGARTMAKRLVLRVTTMPNDTLAVQVAEQTHRGAQFGERDKVFKASNGVRLVSAYTVENQLGISDAFYVRGDDEFGDTRAVAIERAELRKLRTAVAEYNEAMRAAVVDMLPPLTVGPVELIS